ncbi:DNA topoisomerase IB [Microbacterium sp. zg.B48]|uniref:DNA topoisomerase IB n=1 Tax=Microbacterium sp. zg.B48 TaxID=2969408 RepID=UPI00214B7605|nr:DNA topoisomerase IB [Microbacterium sp. zg.B48]MCR2762639.1 DNA topoisomerase IB [Microbacterium sp. zg.B48]
MARLVRVRPGEDPGYRRIRSGSGFRYADMSGSAALPADRQRIHDLVIPPAWQDVWISVDPNAHIQAVGVDDAGRRQYLYHPRWRERRDRRKFSRALELAAALPRARGRVTSALRRDDIDRERVLAASFRLLDQAAPRIGSARYLEQHGSRGLTTLQRRDAAVAESRTTLSFPGKSGKRANIEIDDAELAAVMRELSVGRPRSPLLAYRRGTRRVPLTPADVNSHVRSLTGGAFTAKDFRTLRGTILAAEALARIGTVDTAKDRKRAEALAVRATSEALGNTPAVARSSYIDPAVFKAYERGRILDLDVSPESAIQRLLIG